MARNDFIVVLIVLVVGVVGILANSSYSDSKVTGMIGYEDSPSETTGTRLTRPEELAIGRERYRFHTLPPTRPVVMDFFSPKLAVTRITFMPERYMYISELTLQVRRTVPDPEFNTLQNVYQYVDVYTYYIWDDFIDKFVMDFRVEKKWLRENEFEKDDIVMMVLIGSWGGVKTEYTGEDEIYYYYTAKSLYVPEYLGIIGIHKVYDE